MKRVVIALLATVATVAGCEARRPVTTTDSSSDDASIDAAPVDGLPDEQPLDGSTIDSGPFRDGGGFRPCSSPGMACNAHDPCAIDPICGDDFFCRPSAYQKCDDELPCTTDQCLGAGKCSHEPTPGSCALSVNGELECFVEDDEHPVEPCLTCRPSVDPFKWSPASGSFCDDGDECTKNDRCDNGVCKGTYYGAQCQDKFSCTEDLCDGSGACYGNPLKSDACLINGECYLEGEKDASGCNICDPPSSQNAWTPIKEHCLIDGFCYEPQKVDPTNCSICDPEESTTTWTPIPGLCKIDGACFKQGEVNTSEGGCGECDPAIDPTAWLIKGDDCYIDGACHDPGDTDPTGCGECVPSSDKASWTMIGGHCLIDGLCREAGEEDPTQCGVCDPAVDAAAWSVKEDVCLVMGVCYQPGDEDDTGCGECVPTISKTAFTPTANKCLIGKSCYDDQEKDPTGCLMCSLVSDPSGWVGLGQTTVVSYHWETGDLQGWVADPATGGTGWNVSNKRAAGGTYALYYGDPASGNYDAGGVENSGTVTSPQIVLGTAAKAGLRFWLYIDTEAGTNYDLLVVEVVVGGAATTTWQKNITQPVTMQTWQEVLIDLSAYKGQAIRIRIRFDTVDNVSNGGEGVFIDDLTLYHDCP